MLNRTARQILFPQEVYRMGTHSSHKTRFSDASTFDEICEHCGATDRPGDDRLEEPCPGRRLEPRGTSLQRLVAAGRDMLRTFRRLAEDAVALKLTGEERAWVEEQLAPLVAETDGYMRENGLS